MKCNMGKTDRVIRIVIALAIAAAGIILKSWWGLLALIPAITAATGFCALYKLLGISTNKKSAGVSG